MRISLYPSNFYKVDNYLMRSSQPSDYELEYLKRKEKLTDIFNVSDNSPKLSKEIEISAAKELGINYHEIPTRTENPLQKNIEKFLNAVKKLKENPKSKILVHCNAGVDRTGTYIVFYQLVNKIKPYTEAIQEMITKGHNTEDIPQLLPKIKKIATNMKFIDISLDY